jgi:K+-transporting ATPase ATPase C chain
MKALKLFLLLAFITGILYPFIVFLISTFLFPYQSKGSLLFKEGRLIGSTLIGQKFYSDHYFHSRPSSSDYDALPSFASNLGPTSKQLKELVNERRDLLGSNSVPSDLLFASASGLDPHISLESAFFQAERVAKSRGFPLEKVMELIHLIKEPNFPFASHYVNVLLLNMLLDDEEKV